MDSHTKDDYTRAKLIVTTLKEAGLLNIPDFMVTEKEYLHLWDTVLELQDKLKSV